MSWVRDKIVILSFFFPSSRDIQQNFWMSFVKCRTEMAPMYFLAFQDAKDR